MFELGQWTLFRPWWLLLLPVVWLVSWIFYKASMPSSMWSRLCDKRLLDVLLFDNPAFVSRRGISILIASILSLAVIASSGPSWRKQNLPLLKLNSAQVIAIDLSRSMLAQDTSPTRFARAIFKSRDLVSQSDEQQIALVAFAGAAFMVSPLTDDKATLLNFLDALNPAIMPVQGSRVDKAITMATNILDTSRFERGQILVMTDGVSELAAARRAAENADNQGFEVSILAIGSEAGGPLKDHTGALVRDNQGQVIIAKVGLDDLQQIAVAGGGRFSKLTASDEDINYLTDRLKPFISTLNDTNEHDQQALDDGVWLVWLLLVPLLVLFRKNVLWMIALLFILPAPEPSYASDWDDLWQRRDQQAYQHLQAGEYEKADELSKDLLLQGSARYKLKNYQGAQERFSGDDSAVADYNRGNALAQSQEFEQALDAYALALKKDPDLQDAKFNRKIIEDIIKNQQQSAQQEQQSQEQQSQEQQSQEQQEQSDSQTQQTAQQDKSEQQKQQSQDSQDSEDQAAQQQASIDDSIDKKPQDEQKNQQQIRETDQDKENNQAIERWINRLPDDSSELLRRKFLRDYQRQTGQ